MLWIQGVRAALVFLSIWLSMDDLFPGPLWTSLFRVTKCSTWLLSAHVNPVGPLSRQWMSSNIFPESHLLIPCETHYMYTSSDEKEPGEVYFKFQEKLDLLLKRRLAFGDKKKTPTATGLRCSYQQLFYSTFTAWTALLSPSRSPPGETLRSSSLSLLGYAEATLKLIVSFQVVYCLCVHTWAASRRPRINREPWCSWICQQSYIFRKFSDTNSEWIRSN